MKKIAILLSVAFLSLMIFVSGPTQSQKLKDQIHRKARQLQLLAPGAVNSWRENLQVRKGGLPPLALITLKEYEWTTQGTEICRLGRVVYPAAVLSSAIEVECYETKRG